VPPHAVGRVDAAEFEVGGVVDRRLCDGGAGLACEEALMGGDEDVGERHQAGEDVVLDDLIGQVLEEQVALFFVDIKPDGADVAGFERRDQGAGVDHRSAAGVDEHCAGLHGGQCRGADEVARCGCQRAVEGDDVAAGVKLGEWHVLDAECGAGGVGDGVAGQHCAAETRENAADNGADGSRADDADGLAVHVKAHEAGE